MPKEESSSKVTLSKKEIEEIKNNLLKDLAKDFEFEITQKTQKSEQFSGPVPHPEHMQQYKNIDKTLPDRLTKMAESNLKHIHFIDRVQVFGELFMGFLGWLTPTGLGFYTLYKAFELLDSGKNIEALISLVVALGGLGTAFYMKRRNPS
ncbi:MAG: hypothetical protein KU37_11565 [Sulfuricurvum sp. PC08-66]|nr:MAG: hypothetical protein KU37_11565 [Sulfuricurvum sp. PC08-66]